MQGAIQVLCSTPYKKYCQYQYQYNFQNKVLVSVTLKDNTNTLKSIGNNNTNIIFQKVLQYFTDTAKSISNTSNTNTILQYSGIFL